MIDLKQIHDFAKKWCNKFRDPNIDFIELVDHYLADDCIALGFKMDCGKAFSKKYGSAVFNHDMLDRVIDDVTDIPLLGSAIYSRWRYFNHWAYDGAEILKPENRAWFILVFSRLALLSTDNPFFFQGTLSRIRIISRNIGWDSIQEPEDEREQDLTITNTGEVWFSDYNSGYDGEEYEKARSKNFKIEKADTDRLFSAISAYFSDKHTEMFAADIDDWVMKLTNTEGITYRYRGPLRADFDYEGTDLSDLVRNIVGMDDLYVFDGNRKPNGINRITVDYHRVTKIEPKEVPEDATREVVTWDYTEHLIIDRETETLEHIRNIGERCKISRKYEVEGGIKNLLGYLDTRYLFSHISGNPADVLDTPNETKDYRITIDYQEKPQRIIEGSYDKNGLPKDFANFAMTVFRFMKFYGLGEILDPSIYGKAKRCKSDYIFCSVTFDEGYKSYYYLTDDETIEVGDFVLVPAGRENHEAVVKVVNIEYFNKENVPLPLEVTKRIIRKCTEEDVDVPE